ncbi:MAG: HD domain-containing protein [Anaerolineae bacterium]|nr:HD domain-containing protein [Anaerolineae bacterium]
MSGSQVAERQAVVDIVERWVRARLDEGRSVAHGWLHTDRVRRHALILAPAEGVDPFLAELAALLHDVGRSQPGPESEHGARSEAMARPFLAGLSLPDVEREAVLHAVRWHNSRRADSPLLCILRDADMLDGMGAMGIIRAFMSCSHLPPYDPADPFAENDGRWPASCITDQFLGQMAWYDRLNTETARRLAADRVAFMQAFIAQARRELAIEVQAG